MTEAMKRIPIPKDEEQFVRDFNRKKGSIPELENLRIAMSRVSGNSQLFVSVRGPEAAVDLYKIIVESMCYQDGVLQELSDQSDTRDFAVFNPFHDQSRL